jgi:hypothetical protein
VEHIPAMFHVEHTLLTGRDGSRHIFFMDDEAGIFRQNQLVKQSSSAVSAFPGRSFMQN